MEDSKENPENSDSANKPAEQIMPEPKQVTSLEDIKKDIKETKDGKMVRLPSGLVFRLTQPSISRMLKENAFPSELVTAAIQLDADKFEPKTREEYLRSLEVIDNVVQRACVHPKVSLNEKDTKEDEVYISDISDSDRISIYLYAQTGVKPLVKFRKEQTDSNGGSSVPEVSRTQT
jgi:hypothetical protein